MLVAATVWPSGEEATALWDMLPQKNKEAAWA